MQRPELRGWFRYPGNIRNIPVLAVVAAIAAVWVLTFLEPLPLLIGTGWIVLITVFYFAYARSRWDYLDEEQMLAQSGVADQQ
ncbi:hypothetical protein [Ornithinimicrobium faecis]|uniref:hypothetical protein n=1 Tax=Ornithinimicrobium faecis TaxID=2934158 RepID=UPI002117FD38|nr:hypothetical protein [Ornithinimicrobium sp. HY1745]